MAAISGTIQATVQPSLFINGNSGIFVNINDDYVLHGEATRNASSAVDLVMQNFDRSIAQSEWIIDQVMALAPGDS